MMRRLPKADPKENLIRIQASETGPIPVRVFPTGLPPGTYRCRVERIEHRNGVPTMIYEVIPEDQPTPEDSSK